MKLTQDIAGGELWQTIRRFKASFGVVILTSAILNMLLLAGSLYMMLVYDSVLPSHSIPTLVGLFIMVMGIYAFQCFFDVMRSGILMDVASALDRALSRRVQNAISEAALRGHRPPGDGLGPMRDLESVRTFIGGTGLVTMIDLPWIVFFLGVLFLLHVWLGVTALFGAIVLFGLTLLTNRLVKEPAAQVSQISSYRNGLAETGIRHVELLSALGMRDRVQSRWEGVNDYYLAAQSRLTRSASVLGGVSKIFRVFLQSLILTVGALLVIDGKASGGIIFASSLLSGRALAPVDQAIGNWRNLLAAKSGWMRLNELLRQIPAADDVYTMLPAPKASLAVEQVHIAIPGTQQLLVQGIEFAVSAGSAVGVIGPSGSGKSTLGKALIGIWPTVRGVVRLDGAALNQWRSELLGEHIGYLPQSVELLDGTIAENIGRFDRGATSDDIIAAAQAAAVHDLIVSMPRGYDTPVGLEGANLSAGQRQRIGLARALYRNPFLILLDEPNSNLDGEGEAALAQAIAGIRERGGIAIIIAHRPSILSQIDMLLFMRGGRMEMFGPRDEVLARISPAPTPIDARAKASFRQRPAARKEA